MSPVSSAGGGSAIYHPATTTPTKGKPVSSTPPQSKAGGSDADHDGDTDGGGLDVRG